MKLHSEDTLAHSKAFIFVMDQWVKLLKLGYGDTELAFGNQSLVTYALADDQKTVLAAIVWSYDSGRRVAGELFSSVAEEHRRTGIYTKVIAEVERRAKLRGAVALYSGVHVNNVQMLTSVEKEGRRVDWYRVKKDFR